MLKRAFNWEIQDLITQFIAAFDDVVIGRFNNSRTETDRIEVGYVYQPKRRVLHDIQNRGANLKLPMASIVINSVQRNNNRAFNKSHGFTYPSVRDEITKGLSTVKIPPVVPVDISVTLSIITTYQTDMDQIISNFAAYANPYIMVTWKVPSGFDLPADMPINTKIEWDGNINLEYPVDINHSNRSVITADAQFTIEGWLFKDTNVDPIKNIFFINSNFYNTRILSAGNFIGYDDYASLSGIDFIYEDDQISVVDTDLITVSGSPSITNIYYAISSRGAFVIADQNYVINEPGTIVMYGKRFNYTNNVFISSNNLAFYGTLTASPTYTYFAEFSAAILPVSNYRVITDNVMEIILPSLTAAGNFDIIVDTDAGWDTSYSGMSGHFVVL